MQKTKEVRYHEDDTINQLITILNKNTEDQEKFEDDLDEITLLLDQVARPDYDLFGEGYTRESQARLKLSEAIKKLGKSKWKKDNHPNHYKFLEYLVYLGNNLPEKNQMSVNSFLQSRGIDSKSALSVIGWAKDNHPNHFNLLEHLVNLGNNLPEKNQMNAINSFLQSRDIDRQTALLIIEKMGKYLLTDYKNIITQLNDDAKSMTSSANSDQNPREKQKFPKKAFTILSVLSGVFAVILLGGAIAAGIGAGFAGFAGATGIALIIGAVTFAVGAVVLGVISGVSAREAQVVPNVVQSASKEEVVFHENSQQATERTNELLGEIDKIYQEKSEVNNSSTGSSHHP